MCQLDAVSQRVNPEQATYGNVELHEAAAVLQLSGSHEWVLTSCCNETKAYELVDQREHAEELENSMVRFENCCINRVMKSF